MYSKKLSIGNLETPARRADNNVDRFLVPVILAAIDSFRDRCMESCDVQANLRSVHTIVQ